MALSLSGDGTLSGVDIAASGLGKVLQVVRATDSTDRSTTSTSYVDAAGCSVTISPTKSTSAIFVIASFQARAISGTSNEAAFALTDSSNNLLSGAEEQRIFQASSTNHVGIATLLGYSTPATTSATTYKLRLKASGGSTATVVGSRNTTQVLAIEVSA